MGKIKPPSDKENAAINRGIAKDPDTWEPTDGEFARMRPAEEIAPEVVAAYRRSRGRPKKENPKVSMTLRVDPTVVDFFRATGKGWQTRINDILRKYVETH